MAKVWDRYGNQIELTDERWTHITTGHPELEDYYEEVLETIKKGSRSRVQRFPATKKTGSARLTADKSTLRYDRVQGWRPVSI